MRNKIKLSELPEYAKNYEIVNPDDKEYANTSYLLGYYPDSCFLVYAMNDDLGEVFDIFADYCQEKGYNGYIELDDEKREDYFNEESDNHAYMNDFYTIAGNFGILLQVPQLVQEVSLK